MNIVILQQHLYCNAEQVRINCLNIIHQKFIFTIQYYLYYKWVRYANDD